MDFKQLESFVYVVKYRSFTKAAQHLYISQPTISTHIRSLEDELQSRLIIRTTKNIEVTHRGMELFDCASKMLEMRNTLIHNWTTEKEKIIHLGASTIPSAYILPEILPNFGTQFPDVYFHVEQSNSQSIIDAINRKKYDVGFVGSPCNEEQICCIPFYQDRMVIITPVTEYYLSLKSKQHFSFQDFINQPMILREKENGSQKNVNYFFENMNIKEDQLHVVARINDQESIKNLVSGGLGISFISLKAAQNFIDEKRLLSFELPGHIADRHLYLLYNKNYILKPYIQNFIHFVQSYYLYYLLQKELL